MVTGMFVVSKRVMVVTPETPATRLSQKSWAVRPMGVIAPSPVTSARVTGFSPGSFHLPEDDSRVVAAETHRRGHRDFDRHRARDVRDVDEVALRIGRGVVDGGRDLLVADGHDAGEGFDGATGAHAVT